VKFRDGKVQFTDRCMLIALIRDGEYSNESNPSVNTKLAFVVHPDMNKGCPK
jgi:hypothetical protein